MKTPVKNSSCLGDVLDEVILSEMPLEEQREFKEVVDEVGARKMFGWSQAEQKLKDKKRKRAPKAKAKLKAKAKARGKRQLNPKFLQRQRKALRLAIENNAPEESAPSRAAPAEPSTDAPPAGGDIDSDLGAALEQALAIETMPQKSLRLQGQRLQSHPQMPHLQEETLTWTWTLLQAQTTWRLTILCPLRCPMLQQGQSLQGQTLVWKCHRRR